ncbi:hypothetical protein BH23GEM7_BH23GEM7_22570 [soil metagenome]
MLTWRNRVTGIALAALVATVGCNGDREQPAMEQPATETAVTTEAAATNEMRSTLARLVEAQSAHFEDHQQFAGETTILIDQYGFEPEGDATATIHFQATNPEIGYVATAVHPFSAERCEVHHGQALPDQREFTGEIVCTGADGAARPAGAPATTTP